MAATAATATTKAVTRCSKREGDIAGAGGTSVSLSDIFHPPSCFSSRNKAAERSKLSEAVRALHSGCVPKKGKIGRSPPAEEVEAFLAAAESGMARRFAAKYNYDVVKDAPMDGRYEWVRVGP